MTSFCTVDPARSAASLHARLSAVERIQLLNASQDRLAHLAQNDYGPETGGSEALLTEVAALCRADWAARSAGEPVTYGRSV